MSKERIVRDGLAPLLGPLGFVRKDLELVRKHPDGAQVIALMELPGGGFQIELRTPTHRWRQDRVWPKVVGPALKLQIEAVVVCLLETGLPWFASPSSQH